ncbi:hypothetical protein F5141DRAFT_1202911 [Pisolithus sp. B1]|nr:hypothetical protein F5141DRAFT_1202911 [Pisolithus sp. B1]
MSHTLSKAIQEPPVSHQQVLLKLQSQYTCCPWTFCLYTDPEGWECLEPVDCGTAPGHFKDKHSITNLSRKVELVCMWQGCGCRVIRHNYIRHIREHHLGHDRVVAHANQPLIRLGGHCQVNHECSHGCKASIALKLLLGLPLIHDFRKNKSGESVFALCYNFRSQSTSLQSAVSITWKDTGTDRIKIVDRLALPKTSVDRWPESTHSRLEHNFHVPWWLSNVSGDESGSSPFDISPLVCL